MKEFSSSFAQSTISNLRFIKKYNIKSKLIKLLQCQNFIRVITITLHYINLSLLSE